ncbi:hypothetical protein PCL_08007 [Purpureocillium lilacinum]|uniref:Uncharacterized protein n=1 Tax=Purpureocillium lilacinum TaxID=33203 RepID=A0A2U3EJM6_PURLI|nr:hypothetical protein PCL_08007 [Purpureocillium lilacinum]
MSIADPKPGPACSQAILTTPSGVEWRERRRTRERERERENARPWQTHHPLFLMSNMESPNCHYSLATTPSSALRGAHKCQTMHDTGSFALPPSELPRSSAPERPGQHGLRTGSTELVMPLRARKIGTAARAAPNSVAFGLGLRSFVSSRLVADVEYNSIGVSPPTDRPTAPFPAGICGRMETLFALSET